MIRSGKPLALAALMLALASISIAVKADAKESTVAATGSVEALFTPWDDAEGAIIRALAEAQQSIHVQAYLLTSRSISQALIAAKARGVTVAILADREMVENGKNSQVPTLAAADIPIRLETRYAIAHNKIILIDASTPHGILITGSYNFTWSAQARNAENLLILRDNPALLQRYLNNWQRHHAEAQPFEKETKENKEAHHGH
ncbi:phospholipase D family protein [Rugosibacter aromaticivorans]|uniref:phospholipase D family nuclease n=1 Tax=Rugosibacter aromaticivorans TaxID=1565605 RepID=UPI000ACBD82B|nr:phospholipase D family protein [Rugosibacter aromaticivorans]